MSVPLRTIVVLAMLALLGCRTVAPTERSVRVRVIDTATNQPVPGHLVDGFYAFGERDGTAPFPQAKTDDRGEARLTLDMKRSPVLSTAGMPVSLDVQKLSAGQTQVIDGGDSGCACCSGGKHDGRPTRVEVACE
jgi:hypothetical protein